MPRTDTIVIIELIKSLNNALNDPEALQKELEHVLKAIEKDVTPKPTKQKG